MRAVVLLFILAFSVAASAQVAPNKYWIQFTDKTNTPYTIGDPSQYLSQRAIDRRTRQGIAIDESDLPVDPAYIDSVLNTGAITLIHSSKWFNAISVETTDTAALDSVRTFSFVNTVRSVIAHQDEKVGKFEGEEHGTRCYVSESHSAYYGPGYTQVNLLNGIVLHDMGLKGAGMMIGVLDSGWEGYDQMDAFQRLRDEGRIVGTKDMVDGGNWIFEHGHGSWVLGCMAAELPGELIGTAVDAMYLLVRTENDTSEYVIEEDHWVAGAEYADSVGVDIINTSLGYSTFQDTTQNHSYADLDGNTTIIAIGSDIASSKGILCVTSAGNSGTSPWYYITSPADADSCLAVGSIDLNGNYSDFSGKGPSSDGDVKPNIAAPGEAVYLPVIWGPGTFQGNGTSFSSPLVAGMAACLWQAFPQATNMDIKSAIELSAHQYTNPDEFMGYGIPDFYKAYLILGGTNVFAFTEDKLLGVSYTFEDFIDIRLYSSIDQTGTVELVDMAGRLCYMEELDLHQDDFCTARLDRGISGLQMGNYVIRISTDNAVFTEKLIKPF